MLVATAAAAAAQWQQQRSGSSSTYDRQNNVGKTMNYALGNKFRDAKLDHAVSASRGEGRKPKGEGGGRAVRKRSGGPNHAANHI